MTLIPAKWYGSTCKIAVWYMAADGFTWHRNAPSTHHFGRNVLIVAYFGTFVKYIFFNRGQPNGEICIFLDRRKNRLKPNLSLKYLTGPD